MSAPHAADGPALSMSLAQALDELQAQGAAELDPVGFHLLLALARRAAGHTGPARELMAQRLALHLSTCQTRVAQARERARPVLAQLTPLVPSAAGSAGTHPHPPAQADIEALRAQPSAARLAGLQARLASRQRLAGLVELSRRLAPPPAESATVATGPGAATAAATHPTDGAPHAASDFAAFSDPGLRAVQRFRGTWQRLHADHQLSRSLAKGPESPGPLNSHRLVLQTLQTLRDLSPAYLERLVGQLDAWGWLAQAQQATLATAPADGARRDGERKRRPARSRIT